MPQLFQQAADYGYDKSHQYVDTACQKLPILERTLSFLVPYAKPSIALADRIVDTSLSLVAKPVSFAQRTCAVLGSNASSCKAVVSTKIVAAKSSVAEKATAAKTATTERMEKTRSMVVTKKNALGNFVVQKKVAVSSKVSKQSQAAAERLRLHERKAKVIAKSQDLLDFGGAKAGALACSLRLPQLKEVLVLRGTALSECLSAWKASFSSKIAATGAWGLALVKALPGKVQSVAVRILGQVNADHISTVFNKYAVAPARSIFGKKTFKVEIERKMQ